jgi:hypothetical protein
MGKAALAKKPHGASGYGRQLRQLCDNVLWRPKFLQTLLETGGDVQKASVSAGIHSTVAYQAKFRDPDFEQDWLNVRSQIEDSRSDLIEASVTERAIHGSPRRKFDRDGNLIEEGTDHDTPAALGLLKAYRPAKFREKPPESLGDGIRSLSDLYRALSEIQAERALRVSLHALPEPSGPGPIVITDAGDTN